MKVVDGTRFEADTYANRVEYAEEDRNDGTGVSDRKAVADISLEEGMEKEAAMPVPRNGHGETAKSREQRESPSATTMCWEIEFLQILPSGVAKRKRGRCRS